MNRIVYGSQRMKKMFLRFYLLSLALVLAIGFMSGPVCSQDRIGLYDLWEIQVTNNNDFTNPFVFTEIELAATFMSPSGRKITFFGFYDGDGSGGQTGNTWKLRFMPDEVGTWAYSYMWTDETTGGSGSFVVIDNTNPKNHGHVHVDPNHPKYLVHDDGTPHYWWGANWIDPSSRGPRYKEGKQNPGFISDKQFIQYLDLLESYGHNGLLIKMALFPLENDKYSWDIKWINRAEWLIREMAKRGIYTQVNFFDTWSREKNTLKVNTDGEQQVFNVWKPGDEGPKKNYIKTVIARFASFPNVYWELGNEMEHSPNSGKDFVKQANSKYIPWIRQYDPYNLPIGLSEGCWRTADVDIGFIHQPDILLAFFSYSWKQPVKFAKQFIKRYLKIGTHWDRPVIMNELVRSGITGPMWKDSTIRDSANRIAFRRTFWLMFTKGGCGSSEATWLNFDMPLNQAVLNVMADQKRLRNFVETLPVNINEMISDNTFIISGPGSHETRSRIGNVYVTYFHLLPGQVFSKGIVEVRLLEGNYKTTWFNPKDGRFTVSEMATSNGQTMALDHPSFIEDIVLLAINNHLERN